MADRDLEDQRAVDSLRVSWGSLEEASSAGNGNTTLCEASDEVTRKPAPSAVELILPGVNSFTNVLLRNDKVKPLYRFEGNHVRTILFFARDERFYLFNSVYMLCAIVTCSLATYDLPSTEDLGSRLAITTTLLLVTIAFRQVATMSQQPASSTPCLTPSLSIPSYPVRWRPSHDRRRATS